MAFTYLPAHMSPELKYKVGRFFTWATAIITLFSVVFTYLSYQTHQEDHRPIFGATFSKQFAQELGLDWRAVYEAMLTDGGVRYIRIPTYWNDIESEKGVYTFADIDWQLEQATRNRARVIMVVGRRQPRWPECHDPTWVQSTSKEETRTALLAFISTVVSRYKNHTAIEAWQVENEPFLTIFGECPRISREELQEEIDLVRSIDPRRHILVTDSGELSTWRKTIHAGDLFGTTMYRRTYTRLLGYTTYWWIPPSYYRIKAFLWRRPLETVFNMELQAEPWFRGDPTVATVSEMEKTMTPEILHAHIEYARRAQQDRIYLWGIEWWYWMKDHWGDSRYWEIGREYLKASR